jgi:protein SCO1/2
LDVDGRTVTIEHEAITNYMAAMTMPFRASNPKELADLHPGDQVSFRLQITETDSWIDQIRKTGIHNAITTNAAVPEIASPATNSARHPLFAYKFTNELGQAVSLNQFDGQALAISFIFTRCPIPNFCPRLSKNFEEAEKKLSQSPNAPTNWHLLSVSFDPEFDTPAVLKNYAEQYNYDPQHWSFLTGPGDKIEELARLSGVTFQKDGQFYNHNFRTLIIDAAGNLQMVFPIGGNLSDAIADELLKGAAVARK